jgi:hypothetical protein
LIAASGVSDIVLSTAEKLTTDMENSGTNPLAEKTFISLLRCRHLHMGHHCGITEIKRKLLFSYHISVSINTDAGYLPHFANFLY